MRTVGTNQKVVTEMDNASERLQWLIYGCTDWAEEFRAHQQESVMRYLVTLVAGS